MTIYIAIGLVLLAFLCFIAVVAACVNSSRTSAQYDELRDELDRIDEDRPI